jgi:hypothetical protein
MLALRILTVPIALAVFVAMSAIAEKAPEAVTTTSLVFWMTLPIALLFAAVRRYCR